MRVLVTAGSKHGATAAVADAIAERLASTSLEVWRAEPDEVQSLGDVDAAVIGSAVYAGRWQADALELIERFPTAWTDRRVWLFSSGPVGTPPKPDEGPGNIDELLEQTGATEHTIFAGCIDRDRLGFAERALVRALRAPVGDYRDWEAIRSYADAVGRTLSLAET